MCPFKDPEQKRQYMKAYREKHQPERQKKAFDRELEKQEMIRTLNAAIAKTNPCDINGLFQLDSNSLKSFYRDFSAYRKDFPDSSFPDYQDYQRDEQEWLNEQKTEKDIAIQKAIDYLVSVEGNEKIQVWKKMFSTFFEKYGQSRLG